MPIVKAKVDKNQRDIVLALRQAGASVVHLHAVGKGCPDLLVGFRGDTYLIEIKTPYGKLTNPQRMLHDAWNGKPISIVRTIDEAYSAIGVKKSAPDNPAR